MTSDAALIKKLQKTCNLQVENGRVVSGLFFESGFDELIANGPRLFNLGLQKASLCGTPEQVEAFLQIDGLENLRNVEFDYRTLTNKGARLVAACAALGNLEHLGAGDRSLDAKSLEVLLKALPRLKSLDLFRVKLRTDAVAAIADANLPALEKLSLSLTSLDDAGVKVLCQTRTLTALR